MEKSVKIPEEIECLVEGFKVKVRGKLGEMERDFYSKSIMNIINIERVDNRIKVSSNLENKKGKALIGMIISRIQNLYKGVEQGYKYKLKVVYTHFPILIEQKGGEIMVSNFLGQKGTKKTKISKEVKVEIKKDEIEVSGINKELVGQTAANLEKLTKVSKTDRRRFQDGIFIFEKPRN